MSRNIENLRGRNLGLFSFPFVSFFCISGKRFHFLPILLQLGDLLKAKWMKGQDTGFLLILFVGYSLRLVQFWCPCFLQGELKVSPW